MTLFDFIKMIRKRWLLIAIIVTTGCAAAGYAGTVYLEPVYRATGKIIVSKSSPDGSTVMSAGDAAVSAMLINTYKELIRTPQVVQQVVQSHPELNVTAEQLLESLQVSSSPGSQIMNITWKDRSFDSASDIVNAVIHQFQQLAPRIMPTDHVMIVIPADPATPTASEQTSLAFILLVALVVSSIAAGFLAFMLESLNSGLRETAQVERLLEVPVIAAIPVIRKDDLADTAPASGAKRFIRAKEEQHVRLNG